MSTPTYTMTPDEPGWYWHEHWDEPRKLVKIEGRNLWIKNGIYATRDKPDKEGLWYGPIIRPKFPHFPTTVEEVKAEEERQAKELAAMTPE